MPLRQNRNRNRAHNMRAFFTSLDWLIVHYNLARLTLAFSPHGARRLKRKALTAMLLLCSLLAVAASLLCTARAACHG